MFTGIVERKATVIERIPGEGGGVRLVLDACLTDALRDWVEAELGESIAVSGVCLTVVESSGTRLAFDTVPETLRLTALGDLQSGSQVNLERSLAVGERLGGHFVTGHIDGTGEVIERRPEGDQVLFVIRPEPRLLEQMITKGSITVDGVSLTLVEVDRNEKWFSFAAIPHTLKVTTLGQSQPGSKVNLETDAYGKWVLHGLREIFGQEDAERIARDRGL